MGGTGTINIRVTDLDNKGCSKWRRLNHAWLLGRCGFDTPPGSIYSGALPADRTSP